MISKKFSDTKFYPWLVVGMLWVVAMLNYMDRQMLSTMKTAMEVDISELQSAENFGILMAVFLWIYGLMSPVAGIIADRINRKWLIVGSLFVWSAVTYMMGSTESYTGLYILRAIMGVSEALYIPAGLSLIADYHEGKSRSLAIGIHMTGLYFGQAVGGFGATIADAHSWHLAFHWFGIVGMVYSFVLILLLREKRVVQSVIKEAADTVKRIPLVKGLAMLMSNVAFWVILFYFAAPSLPGWATKNWLPTLFSESLGIPMSEAGPLSTITIAISSFIGVVVGGVLSDRWVKRNVRGRVYTSAIGLFLTIPALVMLGYGSSIVSIVGAGVCFGVGYGMFDANNMPILCQFVPKRLRATGYGIMNMVGVFAGAMVTSLMGSWSQSGDLQSSFALLAIVVAVALVLQLLILRPKTDNME